MNSANIILLFGCGIRFTGLPQGTQRDRQRSLPISHSLRVRSNGRLPVIAKL
jgi:hypothetical protein